MIDLEHRYGPFSGRAWGLMLNLVANAVALYGLKGYLRDGSDLVPLLAGLAVTAACLAVLARPSP